jgi:hypothetical protein
MTETTPDGGLDQTDDELSAMARHSENDLEGRGTNTRGFSDGRLESGTDRPVQDEDRVDLTADSTDPARAFPEGTAPADDEG